MTQYADGKCLTVPKWGFAERVVVVKSGIAWVDGGKHKFLSEDFFSVNRVIKKI